MKSVTFCPYLTSLKLLIAEKRFLPKCIIYAEFGGGGGGGWGGKKGFMGEWEIENRVCSQVRSCAQAGSLNFQSTVPQTDYSLANRINNFSIMIGYPRAQISCVIGARSGGCACQLQLSNDKFL